MDNLKHRKMSPNHPFGDYVVSEPIPKAVFYDEIPSELKDKYVVIHRPRLDPGLSSVQ